MSVPHNPPSRRTFLAAGIGAGMVAAAEPAPPDRLLDVDYRKLVSRADLVYEKPVARSEEGIPTGNGRMGSLVWTTPTQLRFQINRVDVYASNCASNSFFERHTDYCGGCGFVDIDFAAGGETPFPESGFRQHLSVYDGSLVIQGQGVTAKVLASPAQDVIAVVLNASATPRVRLRMLRYEANSAQSEKLARDHVEVLEPVWKEFLANLAPLPGSADPESLKPANYQGPRVFVRGLKPVVKGGGFLPDGNSLPMWFFDLCNVESRDRSTVDIANATLTQTFRNGVTARTPVSVLSKLAIAAASLGRADAVRFLIPNQMRALAPERATAYKNGGVLANRMTLREGPQALDAERLGRASEALHLALLQSNPPAPGEDAVLHVFPAWPKEWSASYTLLARGGFLVSASIRDGRVAFVELESQAGAECLLRNPFDGEVTLYRDGSKAELLKGMMLRFGTRKGERVTVLAAGASLADARRSVP